MKLDKNSFPGLFDYENPTELDDIAYQIYFDKQFNKNADNYWWTQRVFINMNKKENNIYYKKASIILRSLKINKLQNET